MVAIFSICRTTVRLEASAVLAYLVPVAAVVVV